VLYTMYTAGHFMFVINSANIDQFLNFFTIKLRKNYHFPSTLRLANYCNSEVVMQRRLVTINVYEG